MLNAIIIEDETAAAVNLQAVIKEVAPDVEVTALLESIGETVEYFARHPQPDLIFMDIHLADGNSFRIFDMTEITSPVIFTTAYDNYALKAFEVNSIDYLLKPIKTSDVERAINKFRRFTHTEKADYKLRMETMTRESREEIFLIPLRDKLIPLHRDEIAFCHTANERVTAYTFAGEQYPLDKTLEALQAQLPHDRFFRANRQFIVARQAVKEISIWFGSRLSVHLTVDVPERIIISKVRVPEFKAWMKNIHPDE